MDHVTYILIEYKCTKEEIKVTTIHITIVKVSNKKPQLQLNKPLLIQVAKYIKYSYSNVIES